MNPNFDRLPPYVKLVTAKELMDRAKSELAGLASMESYDRSALKRMGMERLVFAGEDLTDLGKMIDGLRIMVLELTEMENYVKAQFRESGVTDAGAKEL